LSFEFVNVMKCLQPVKPASRCITPNIFILSGVMVYFSQMTLM